MNAVIVDIRKKQAAALDEDGRVVRIHNAGYELGQTIELHEVKPVRTPTMLKRLSTGVAAAVLVAMIGTGTAYAMPYGTVTLDGDASIEYTINCFDYVLDVQAVNEAGEALLEEMDIHQLRHHRVERAVSATLDRMEQRESPEGAEEIPQIRVETRNEDHSERLLEEMKPAAERHMNPFDAPDDFDSGIAEIVPDDPFSEPERKETDIGEPPPILPNDEMHRDEDATAQETQAPPSPPADNSDEPLSGEPRPHSSEDAPTGSSPWPEYVGNPQEYHPEVIEPYGHEMP